MRKWIAAVPAVILLIILMAPSVSYTEDTSTIQLARTLYALGRGESYETKLAIGTVVMNRVESPWFDATLAGVLSEQQQFPAGERYDDESLRAAHAVLAGERTLDSGVLYFQSEDASDPWSGLTPAEEVGGYRFYTESGNI